MKEKGKESSLPRAPLGGLAGWLLGRLRTGHRAEPRLKLIERIALAPRQSVALIEAEGRRFLVATSAEGAPAFFAFDEGEKQSRPAQRPAVRMEAGHAETGARGQYRLLDGSGGCQ